MRITHCVCTNRSFRSLIDEARRERLTLDELVRRTGASDGCGMCKPYLREALSSGQTVFTQLIVDRTDAGAA
jgi:NAD(P)H-nitrite reductase large subunit